MPKLKLIKTVIEALPLTKKGQVVYYDTQLTGFGVYVGKTAKTYFAQRQIGRKTCRVTIGAHGVFTTEQARTEARDLLMRMAKGEDPNEEKRSRRFKELTLRQTVELYLEARRNLRPFTQETYRRIIYTHLKDWADRPMPRYCRRWCSTAMRGSGRWSGSRPPTPSCECSGPFITSPWSWTTA